MKHLFPTIALCTLLLSCGERIDPPLVLNEICGKEFPENEWVEIYNPTDSVVSLKGVYLIKIDEDGIDHEMYRFKDGSLQPGEVYVISSLKKELRRRISHKKELGVELVGPDDKTLDAFYRDDEVGEQAHPENGSYARIPNGKGPWYIVRQASRGELNPDDAEILTGDPRFDADYDEFEEEE